MKKVIAENKKLVKTLQTEVERLQKDLVQAKAREGKDPFLTVKVKKSQARQQKLLQKNQQAALIGKFYLEVAIASKEKDVYIPLSIATGKKVAGFMYQIEGSAPGSVATAEVSVHGESISMVTIGTLVYAKIPAGKIALFQLQVTIRGASGKQYKLVFVRLNYKLDVGQVRYQQYLKEIHSDQLRFT